MLTASRVFLKAPEREAATRLLQAEKLAKLIAYLEGFGVPSGVDEPLWGTDQPQDPAPGGSATQGEEATRKHRRDEPEPEITGRRLQRMASRDRVA